jgi:AcrR family transcriptional regulator
MSGSPTAISPFKTKEGRLAERHQKKEAVLNAAVKLFNDRGFHAASLDELSSELGVGKPTIYHYWGNKEQILLECLARGYDQIAAVARSIDDVPGTGLERLRAYLMAFGMVVLGDFGRLIAVTGPEHLSSEENARVRVLKREADGEIRKLLAEGMADGSIEPGDVKIAAFTIAGALGWMARWFSPEKKYAMDATVAAVVDTLTKGLARR